MYSLLFLALASFTICLVLTPLVRATSLRFGLVDRPDASRKPDYRPIPRVGGIAVALAFVLSYAFWWLTPMHGIWTVHQNLGLISRLAPAVGLIFLIGLLDDLVHLKASWKFAGQIGAAIIAYFAGVHVMGFSGAAFTDWWWTLPATVIWLVACTNAINLIDGVDGLAAGLSLVATVSMILGAALSHNVLLAFATVPLAGCLIGFLRYNFNPASVYLGDSGSLLVGFLLGCCGVLSSQKSATILGMTAPLMALSIPLLDTSLAIVRRFLRRQPIFGADRGHIHHRLLDRGLTPRHTALLLYGAGGIAAMFSLFMANNHLEVPVLLVFGVATWLGIQRLGFVEFDAVGRLMMSGSFRGLLSSQIVLESLKSRLSSAETTDEYWMVLESSYRELGFLSIHLCFAGRSFCTAPAKSDSEYWRLEIPLLGSDYVELRHPFNVNSNPSSVSFLADMLHETLVSRYLGEPKLARSAALGD
jgi:UDP-GlcNAc:undecaprenyl-phosphate GlcNAc-1-phosphate transferase